MSRKHPVCVDLEPDLIAASTGEASATAVERVDAHVARCAPCRDDLARYRAVDRTIGALRAAAAPDADADTARARLRARLADLRSRLVTYAVFDSPLGAILLARSEHGVSLVEYVGRGGVAGSSLARLGDGETVEDRAALEPLHAELLEYLTGRRKRLDWPLDLRLARSDFHRTVLRATAAMPYGALTSYAGIAGEIGSPRAVRAVAQALRHNPVPIVVPCHRIIGTSGDLTGYAGKQLGLKARLLAVEGVRTERGVHTPRVARQALYHYDPNDQHEYCLPTCGSIARRPIGRVTLLASQETAKTLGLVPCTACRPDLHPLPSA
jgi:methylated-DNA-[protein]-cysteine S-methyltransferase